ncbi:tRNA(Met) cytidine acetyltransferase TmcA [Thiobaca trueperi]|uniref:tRNA(Met) cytidine acetyltransferase TmcA n=1 Tax=Thiobaca trueperi TaxID=127458 RepID=A0A4R3MW48_9GAMM|nr:GNAT family N-acetyltransferase [Thiobaca trueperi]TCT18114.1 tRNA(Met)-cytidine N(4)-acetyltransferase [Thiobaca trueperi]
MNRDTTTAGLGLLRQHRTILLLAGEADWTAARAREVVSARPDLTPVWLTHRPLAPKTHPLRDAIGLLGQDLDLLIYDAHSGFDPDAFGAATGAIRGGGLLILLTPPLDNWSHRPDPEAERIAVWPHAADAVSGRFLARLVRVLLADPHLHLVQQFEPLLLPRWEGAGGKGAERFLTAQKQTSHSGRSPPSPQPLSREGRGAKTTDQAAAVEAILKTAHGRARRPLVLTAHRGRGKSAALGLAAGRLLIDGERMILVTAPRRAAVVSLFRHAEALTASQSKSTERLVFLSPDTIVADPPVADLLLVDEAAAIPTPLLERLLVQYPRIVFATTVHGYEGTGRGFEIRFRATLDHLTPDWRALRLDTPIRWAPDDPLEALSFRALLLDAAPADAGQLTTAMPSTCRAERLDRDQLALDEPTLRELFGLLVLAHYQTRPLDLRMLLDGPNVRVYVLRHGAHVAATLLAAEEGGFMDAGLREAIFMGRRRPRGHLLPQTLSAHAGLADAPRYRYLRVIRIAVHPALSRRGLGGMLLRRLRQDALDEGIDLLGASFGATPDLLAFWGRCGYRPVQIGTSRNAASGEQAAVVLDATTETGARFAAQAQRRLARRLPVLLAGPLRALDPVIVVALLRALPAPSGQTGEGADGDPDESRDELNAFAAGHRTLEATLPALTDFVHDRLQPALESGIIAPDDAALLIAAIRQFRPMHELIRLFGSQGRDAILTRLRGVIRSMME